MPFAGYSDFDACTSANSDKNDPEAYCAAIQRRAEGKLLANTEMEAWEMDALAMETKEWTGPHEGPRGGTYWENTDTGEQVYQDEPPGDVDPSEMEDYELVNAIHSLIGDSEEAREFLEDADDRTDVQEKVEELLGQDGGDDGDEGSRYEEASARELEAAALEVAAPDVVDTIVTPDMDADEVRESFEKWLSDAQLEDIKDDINGPDDLFDEVDTSPDWDSVNAAVPERPDQTVKDWEESQRDELIAQAKEHDMEPEEYREALAEEYSRIMDESQAAARVPIPLIEDVLEDGRLKNQHETNSSSGWLDPELREKFESEYMGVDPDTDDENKPIYGYASAPDAEANEEAANLSSYGNASLRLSDDAKERGTVTFGDSLSSNRGWINENRDIQFTPTPATDPDEKALDLDTIPVGHDEDTQLELLQNADDPSDISMYNEMQFHGGLSVEDIEEVRFDVTADHMEPPDDEILAQLDDAGIDYEVEA